MNKKKVRKGNFIWLIVKLFFMNFLWKFFKIWKIFKIVLNNLYGFFVLLYKEIMFLNFVIVKYKYIFNWYEYVLCYFCC